ncbi:MAG: alkaline phosphatase PafA [Bacteroidota bacterium]|jgi:predicted AlkP superfamily pyrophosphatase or phosphodiesterase
MKKISILYVFSLIWIYPIKILPQLDTQPKLVVGIVVDQMRYDYLSRFWNKFGNDGFKRLINEGFLCSNTHYNYVPTYTAPGHASIYSGTTPAVHGIISNNWYDKVSGNIIYCVDDQNVNPVGTSSSKGRMSPKRFLATSISDQLRIQYLKKSKTFGIALKERSAILPAGHSANGAFWFDGSTGGFVSSTHYIEKLPKWVADFNIKNHASAYLKNDWKPLLPIDKYSESTEDNSKYENAPVQPGKPFFPYNFSEALREKKFDVIAYTPYGNTITKDLAIECIKSERLGKDEFSDLLCLSFSSTDIIAHAYGIRSIEVEDVYLRLDKDIEELLKTLDTEVGKGNYSVFLTADHGGAENTEFLKDYKIPAGLINDIELQKQMRSYLYNEYKDSLVLSYSNQQVFLNERIIIDKKLNKTEIKQKLTSWLLDQSGIVEVYSSEDIQKSSFASGSMKYLMQKGYHQKLSGDLLINYAPAWMEHESKGTTHGAPYSYDTHVPLIFYGMGIKKGESKKRYEITDIAPTIAQLLNIEYPNGSIGNPIEEVFIK